MHCGKAPGLRLRTPVSLKIGSCRLNPPRPPDLLQALWPRSSCFPRSFSIELVNSNLRALIGPAETWLSRRRGQTYRTLAMPRDVRQYGNIELSMQGETGQGR